MAKLPNLVYCTITGVDKNTSIEDLVLLSEKYPFVEWGLLARDWEETRKDNPRYLDLVYIDKLLRHNNIISRDVLKFSFHVCSKLVADIFENEIVLPEKALFLNRIQLNLKKKSDYKVVDMAYKIEQLILKWNIPVITQYENISHEVTVGVGSWRHHSLFDVSGGKGKRSQWPKSLPEKSMCGFAGGISPDTIKNDIEKVAILSKGLPCWIDMETGVRTNNYLDLNKVESVLKVLSEKRIK